MVAFILSWFDKRGCESECPLALDTPVYKRSIYKMFKLDRSPVRNR